MIESSNITEVNHITEVPLESASLSVPSPDLKQFQLYANILSSFDQAVIATNLDGKIIYCNAALEKMLDLSAQEILGRFYFDFLADENSRNAVKKITHHLEKNLNCEKEVKIRKADSTHLHIITTTTRLIDNNKELIGYVTIATNIAYRTRAERDLYENEERLKLALESAKQGLYDLDIRTGKAIISSEYAKMLGYDAESFEETEQKWLKRLHPDDSERVYHFFQDYLNGKIKEYKVEFRQQTKAGGWKWILSCGKIVEYDDEGKPIRMLGIHTDITELKKIEDTLREREASLQSIFRVAPVGIGIISNRIIKQVNDEICRMTRYEKSDLIEKNSRILYPTTQEYKYVGVEKYHQIKVYGSGTIETRWQCKDGEIINIILSFTPLDWHDLSKGITFTALNITLRKKAEEELKASERRFRLLFDQAAVGVAIIETETGRYLKVNRKFCDIVGYSSDELKNLTFRDIAYSDDLNQNEGLMQKLVSGKLEEFSIEKRSRKKDGTIFWILKTVSPMWIPGEPPNFCISIIQDITYRKKVENESMELTSRLAEKNKELEQIIYVTSHDLRSPLVNIIGFSRELELSIQEIQNTCGQTQLPKNIAVGVKQIVKKDIPESLSFIKSSAQKMDALLSGLLRLSRLGRAAIRIEKLNMQEILLNILNAVEYQIKENNIDVTLDHLPSCQGDRVQINQIFSNLIDNAIKYMDKNRLGFIHISGERRNSECIYCVSDNGVGIDPNHFKRIFEIFYRLEPDSTDGEGLGLTIVQRIIERHNGRIWVESTPGVGSQFFVALPF